MILSCCAWALSGPEEQNLDRLAEMGFRHVDVRPQALRSPRARQCLADLGLRVPCVAIAFPEVPLDSPDEQEAARALAQLAAGLHHAHELGASTAYVVPGMDSSPPALARYARAIEPLAEQAAGLSLRLGIEHFPGRCLPTGAATLEFIENIGHPNLYLLFDLGHAQISAEDPAALIRRAGARLGYVHLDDNDGRQDLHLGLLEGVLTEATLRQTCAALEEVSYQGPVSLELHPPLPDPLDALRRSREVTLRLGPGER
ncbi:MAG: sugar phosphate isomerase/epimerase [Candidatus Latescibacteria bacterium]|nr:sugar phosphate isomerase/epimerase [Candidatus Latescibacterota bacterium]